MESLSAKRQLVVRKRRKDVQAESAFKDRWRGGRHRESVAKWVDESGVKTHEVRRGMQKQEAGRLPVLLSPTILNFYTDDPANHKIVLSIYNPYDFAIKFKVLCTAPSQKYSVIDPEGCIRPQYCVDLLVRHHEINAENVDVEDKFLIHLYENGNPRTFGQREVIAVLRRGKKDENEKDAKEQYQQINRTQGVEPPPQFPLQRSSSQWRVNTQPNFYIAVITAIVCILALFLPTGDEKQTWLPDYIRLSVNQKCIISYVLGLVTMALFGFASSAA